MWSDDIGLDGNDSLDEDEIEQRGLLPAGPIRSHEWYRLMVDFAAQVTDAQARDLLEVALDGRGAFRRFRDVLHRRHPELFSAWRQFEEVGGRRMAVDWLAEEELISRDAAAAYALEHPLPEVP